MKYLWNGINTGLLFILFIYLMITKNINTTAVEKCDNIEDRISYQEKEIDQLFELTRKRDTIIVNIKNYNYNNEKKK